MNFAQKLDMLQEFAIACKNEPHKLHLIQRLAEHAEDSEMTADFLEWLRKMIVAS
ncbi:MAG: hypothetical protein FWD06_02665 [Oscillospiraceae bacterium]|nr:hypothetical protein [Oscillospiraceae bacterium]